MTRSSREKDALVNRPVPCDESCRPVFAPEMAPKSPASLDTQKRDSHPSEGFPDGPLADRKERAPHASVGGIENRAPRQKARPRIVFLRAPLPATPTPRLLSGDDCPLSFRQHPLSEKEALPFSAANILTGKKHPSSFSVRPVQTQGSPTPQAFGTRTAFLLLTAT